MAEITVFWCKGGNKVSPVEILLIVLDGKRSDALEMVKKCWPLSAVTCVTKAEFKRRKWRDRLRTIRGSRESIMVIYCHDFASYPGRIMMRGLCVVGSCAESYIMDSAGRKEVISILSFVFCEMPAYTVSVIGVHALISLMNQILFGGYLLLRLIGHSGKPHVAPIEARRFAFLKSDYDKDITGGAPRHVEGFAEAMVKLGRRINFVSPYLPAWHSKHSEMVAFLTITPTTTFNCLFVETSQIAYTFKVAYQVFRTLRGRPIDFIYHRSSTLNCAGAMAALLLKKPLILEFNSSALWKTDTYVKRRFLATRRLMECISLEVASKVMVVSEVLKRQLTRRGVDREKIYVNPNGADPRRFNPAVAGKNLRAEYGLSYDVAAGFSGMFAQWHGVETLVSAVKLVARENSRIHFFLIGDGILRSELEAMMQNEGIGDRVTFTGQVASGEMPAYLNSLDILVSPHRNMADGSEFFGSPIKIFEYMAMGKAIVASDVGQLRQILIHGRNAILVPAENPEALARAIVELAENAALRVELGQRARQDFLENYTWERNAQNVLNAFRDISEKRKKA